jgi:ABC-2 type transport system ATP-binding protein
MHNGTFRHEGTVAELTRTLPAAIRFSLPAGSPAPLLQAAPLADGSYQIETFDLQTDLKQLLDWAHAHSVDLVGLSAAPTRLDDVFRAIEADPVAAA